MFLVCTDGLYIWLQDLKEARADELNEGLRDECLKSLHEYETSTVQFKTPDKL